MALIYLLDTNTISEIEHIPANPNVLAQAQAHRQQMAIASVSWQELLFGYYRLPESMRKQRVGYFLEKTVKPNFPILLYDQAAAAWFAKERARLAQIGRPPSYSDGQIAAIAAANNLILITRNTADFADFAGLTVENWFES